MNYDYGNARLRAMKARLLSAEQLQILAQVRTLPAFIAELTRTPYRRAAEYASVQATGIAQVGNLVQANIIETLGRIRTFYQGDAQQQVDLLLQRYDVQNLKAILRGLASNIAADEIKATLMPIGRLTTHILNEIIDADNIRDAIDRLVTLGDPLAKPLITIRTGRPGWTVWELELALEKWYFDPARYAHVSSKLVDYINLEADIVNLMTMFRFANEPGQRQMLPERLGVDMEDLLVPPGKLSYKRLLTIGMSQTIEESIAQLEGTAYFSALQRDYAAYQHRKQLSVIERSLVSYKLKRYATWVSTDPLGIGVPIGYLSLKKNEGRNLRQIAWGVHLGLDHDSIVAELEVI